MKRRPAALTVALLASAALAQEPKSTWKFDFGTGAVAPGYTQVTPDTTYSPERGYGFEPGAAIQAISIDSSDPLRSDALVSTKPFLFSVRLPEGNYNVTLLLGDPKAESTTTVRAESRRLMLEHIHTSPGQFVSRTFTVNIRTPEIAGDGRVKTNDREKGSLTWDDKLTLEFNDQHPAVCGIEITPAPDAITLFIAGDSTVTDQAHEPWTGWGQILPRFFQPGVAVANHAESGRALKSFLHENRLAKILSQMKKGDYLFIQFAHNDMKKGGAYAEAHTTYKELLKQYIEEARKHGGQPVLVTPMHRRFFNADGTVKNTLEDYPEAMREVAKEDKVPLIDLNAMSKKFYEALGEADSVHAFVHYPAGTFPGQEKELKDNTHFNAYGGYELAKCVVEGIREDHLGLEKYLTEDVKSFDPSHPDDWKTFSLPASPDTNVTTPEGR